jgi:penicillin amidase
MKPWKVAVELASGLLGEVQRASTEIRGRLRTPGARVRERLAGLRAPVEILTGRHGMPFIYARAEDDLFFVQGYLHAQERLFQMDFLRRVAQGRMAETFGERPLRWQDLTVRLKGKTTVDLDHYLQAFDLAGAARACLPRLSQGGLRVLEHYSRGVNRYIESARLQLPLELRLLGISPEPWTPADSLLLYKGFAFQLAVAYRAKLTADALGQRLAGRPELVASLFPRDASDSPTVLGSNCVALAGSRSVTGRPLLANDPHLPMQAPTLFFQVHLSAGGLEVAGVGAPGLPGVVIGHNRDLAWGITHAYVEDSDVILEDVDRQGRVRRGDQLVPLQERAVSIAIKGAKPAARRVRWSEHGPLISDILVDVSDGPSGPPPGFGLRRAQSVRWTGFAPATDLEGFLGFARASTWDEFRAAARHLHTPAWNLTYADAAGHIGYQLAGAVPRRDPGEPFGALPGWEAAPPQGLVPFEELPHSLDPGTGYVVTANQRIVADDYPHLLSRFHEPPYRARRLAQLVEERPRHDVADLRRMQLDQRSLWAQRILDEVLRPHAQSSCALDIHVDGALSQLVAWNGEADLGSCSAALFYAFIRAFVERLLRGRLGDDLCSAYLELANQAVLPLERIIAEPGSPWFADDGERDRMVDHALADAVTMLRQRYGDDKATWRWGALHPLVHRHPLGHVAGMNKVLNIGPYPAGGDGTTVGLGGFSLAHPFAMSVGPAARLVMDAGNWDRSAMVLSTGQSGRALDPHYADQAELHARGRLAPWPFTRSAVEDAAVRRTMLLPRPT